MKVVSSFRFPDISLAVNTGEARRPPPHPVPGPPNHHKPGPGPPHASDPGDDVPAKNFPGRLNSGCAGFFLAGTCAGKKISGLIRPERKMARPPWPGIPGMPPSEAPLTGGGKTPADILVKRSP
jgi:hypothetical protein